MLKFAVSLCCLALCSCAHVFTKKETYEHRDSQQAQVNGASIYSLLEPQGGNPGLSVSAMVYFAGSADLKGPFKWHIKARGKTGEHQTFRVKAVKVTTRKSGRSQWFPRHLLGADCPFKPTRQDKSVAIADFEFPGLLEVYPEQDGAIDLLVDVTVISSQGRRDQRVRFSLEPSQKKETEFVFLPSEIVKSFSADKYAEEE